MSFSLFFLVSAIIECFYFFFLLEQKETKIQESLMLQPARPTLACLHKQAR